jgi:hypothetical protein
MRREEDVKQKDDRRNVADLLLTALNRSSIGKCFEFRTFFVMESFNEDSQFKV